MISGESEDRIRRTKSPVKIVEFDPKFQMLLDNVIYWDRACNPLPLASTNSSSSASASASILPLRDMRPIGPYRFILILHLRNLA